MDENFVKKVMQFVTLYAQDVRTFYSMDVQTFYVRTNPLVCDEQLYKQSWIKFKLLTVKSLFFLNDLSEEEFAEFFENYSLR